jgi:hypothetical protein
VKYSLISYEKNSKGRGFEPLLGSKPKPPRPFRQLIIMSFFEFAGLYMTIIRT